MKHRYLSLLPLLLLPLGTNPILVNGQEETSKPSLNLYSYSTTFDTNSSCYLYIDIDNPVDVASIQFELYFDNSYLSASNVSNQCESSIFDYKINDDSISFTYVFTTTLNENTNLLIIWLDTSSKIGKTNLDLAVLDANSSTSNIEVSGDYKNISLVKSTSKKYCDFYSSLSKSSSLKEGEEFDISYSSYCLSDIAAGDFTISYDRDELEFVSFTNGSFLDDSSVTSNYKANKDGNITLSFIASSNVYSYDLLSLRFRIKNNNDGSTDISFKSTSLTDFSFVDFTNVSVSDEVSYVYDSSLVIKKQMYMDYSASSDNKSIDLTINIEEGSNLAAGDFELYFPTSYLAYTGYKDIRDKKVVENLIVNVTKATSGYIAFHIFNINNNITSKASFLTMSFSLINPCLDFLSQVSLSGEEMCDLSSKVVELDFPSLVISYKGLGHQYGDWVIDIDATCKVNGKKHRVCSICGYKEESIIEKHPDGCDECLVKEFIKTYITSQKDEPYEGLSEQERYSSCSSKYNLAKEALEKLPESARDLFLTGEEYKEDSSIYNYWASSINQNRTLSSSPIQEVSMTSLISILSLIMVGVSITLVLLSRKRIRH